MAEERLASICTVLAGMQQTDGAARKAAEEHLDEAEKSAPDALVGNLCLVLAAGAQVPEELRQEAAVLLRQLVLGVPPRESSFEKIEAPTKVALMGQLLVSLGEDPSNPVKRNVGQLVSATANTVACGLGELRTEWPDFLPALSRYIASEDSTKRAVTLGVLKDLVPNFGEDLMSEEEELMKPREQVMAMLGRTLGDPEAEVRAAAVQLVMQLVADLQEEDFGPLEVLMPTVVTVLQSLATEAKEELLKETLMAFMTPTSEEAEFFRDNLQALWQTLMGLCAAPPESFSDSHVRQNAMEVAVNLAVELSCEPPMLEQLMAQCLEWMLEVEEDVETWTREGKEDNEDECDEDVVEVALESLDQLAQHSEEEDSFMGILFKLIRAAALSPASNWKHARAGVAAIAQVVEYVESTAWIDQCVDFIAQRLAHQHPRVRFAAFSAVGQVAYDQEPYVQETHSGLLLPAIVTGIQDDNIRVATEAVLALSSLADELDPDDFDPHLPDLLGGLFLRLEEGETRSMQEACLGGIASIAEALKELFEPSYGRVAPLLMKLIRNATSKEERSLRGKAFECISSVGSVVGKSTFSVDAHEVMRLMTQMMQAGFDADDTVLESVRESSKRIAKCMGKEFKAYVPVLLPILFETLKQRPTEVDGPGMDDDTDADSDDEAADMTFAAADGRLLQLKTSVVREMVECIDLVQVLIEALEEEFCEFLAPTCQAMLPLLEIPHADIQEEVLPTWEALVECARLSAEHQRLPRENLQELVGVFLEKTMAALQTAAQSPKLKEEYEHQKKRLGVVARTLQKKALGVSGVVRKSGKGVLLKNVVQHIASMVVQLISNLPRSAPEDGMDDEAVPARRGRAAKGSDEEDEDEEEEVVTSHSVRMALADVVGALLRTSPEDFVEVALQPYMQFVQSLLQEQSADDDRGLAFYMTSDLVDCLGAQSVPCWNGFMNQALQCLVHKSALVRQYASSTIGNAASQPIFGQMGPAAASALHRILQKQGERHRRRKAVNRDVQAALAVDAGIRALGEIAEHHEGSLGAHAAVVWGTWLANLPLRYDEDAGQKAHTQLLQLVSRSHPIITSPANRSQVMTVLAEVYKTKFSNEELDDAISQAVAMIGAEPLKEVCSTLQAKHCRKIEHILHSANGPRSVAPSARLGSRSR